MFNPTLVHEYLRANARKHPEKVAVVCGDQRLTYGAIDSMSDVFAGRLIERGMRRHDRVILFLDNSAEVVIAIYGVLKAGGTFVVLNGSLKAGKLGYILMDSGARFLVSHVMNADVVAAALAETKREVGLIWVGAGPVEAGPGRFSVSSWNEMVRADSDGRATRSPALQNGGGGIDQDLAALIYTSGSTGEPKGVMSSHLNMVSAARSIIQYLENRSDDITLTVLPLSFDYGLYQVIMAFMFGGTVVLERSFLYPVKFLECIQREKVTGLPLVPTIAAMLLKMQSIDRYDLSSLRYVTNTAAALPVDHIQRLRALLPHARLYSMYGLTECKRVCYLPPEELDRRPSSVGKAMPNTEVLIVNEAGEEVLPGVVGELVVRGAHVMRGYWNAPELTAATFRTGRFPGEIHLYTGDLFRKDEEGFLYFVGRKDDMIKCKGERVSPREVENTLFKLDGVAEVAVIGIPDEVFGHVIKAFVVRRKASSLNERDVLRHCAANLEALMVPKSIEFLEDLPKTTNGKIDKTKLKDRANERREGASGK